MTPIGKRCRIDAPREVRPRPDLHTMAARPGRRAVEVDGRERIVGDPRRHLDDAAQHFSAAEARCDLRHRQVWRAEREHLDISPVRAALRETHHDAHDWIGPARAHE